MVKNNFFNEIMKVEYGKMAGQRVKHGLCNSKRRRSTRAYTTYKKMFEEFVKEEIPDDLMESSFAYLKKFVESEKKKAMLDGRRCEPEFLVGKPVEGNDGNMHVKFEACNNN